MAVAGSSSAVPVWLTEDDLGCVICHGLLDWPATLPCGHSFCRRCLERLWGAPGKGGGWACPTCREGARQRPPLRKCTLLQDLVDKYSRALRELDAGPGRAPAGTPAEDPVPAPRRPSPLPAAAQKSITEVGRELVKLVEQLVDITGRLQNQRSLPQSEAYDALSILDTASCDVDLSLASPKIVTSNTSDEQIGDVLHALEEIQEKLQKNFMGEKALNEQTQVELPETPSTSSGPLSNSAPRKASQFAHGSNKLTFDLSSLSCSLELSEDGCTVTVSHWPQFYPWSRERFETCQVLCSPGLSYGQCSWKVDTQHCSYWAVGVASWRMSRDKILGRTEDSWCVEWRGTGQLSAWHMAKEVAISSDKPAVVGIQLDLMSGKLAFYEVTHQEKFLYECSVPVSYPLHPAFWLYGLLPGNKLTLKQEMA
ncbi:PREDICTED: E3 ubiquitin-protein ligase RNF135 [Elephantulus edwardii]|uniref:E3 ubiquitin-protein ligase RNF135 n=1 Tax=Elephantulus edwardii TaxID=28737 RepID=UPI0003F0C415|nr:PREDICTED: E3 ubiquitin-protein ligase RNF135 [Elephantulus edwardii]